MVEAGLDLSTTKSRLASLNIKLSDIDALLITHRHGDHCKSKTVERIALTSPVVANQDVINFLKSSISENIKTWQIRTEKAN